MNKDVYYACRKMTVVKNSLLNFGGGQRINGVFLVGSWLGVCTGVLLSMMRLAVLNGVV